VQGASFSIDQDTTIRSLIVTWALDILAVDGKDGTVNSRSPVTIGLDVAQSDDDVFGAHPGPFTEPSFPWYWWDGAVFTNAYGFATSAGSNGAVLATGKITRQAPFTLPEADGIWVAPFMVFEIQDVDTEWSSASASVWFQLLTAPVSG
jgi:hypothetical protein